MKKITKVKNVKRILVITLSNIGDVILTTPTIESLHSKFPNATFDIVGDKQSKILFKYCPYVSNFYEKDISIKFIIYYNRVCKYNETNRF